MGFASSIFSRDGGILAKQKYNSLLSLSLMPKKYGLLRKADDLATEHQRQKHLQKLTYSGDGFDGVDFSYDTVMGDTAKAIGARIFTDRTTGKVVVSDKLASELGITAQKGTGDDFKRMYPTENDLVRKFVPEATNSQIETAKSDLAAEAANDVTGSAHLTKTEIAEYAKDITSKFGEYPTAQAVTYEDTMSKMGTFGKIGASTGDTIGSDKEGATSFDNLGTMQFSEILSGDVRCFIGSSKTDCALDVARKRVTSDAASRIDYFLNNISIALEQAFGGSYPKDKIDTYKTTIKTMLEDGGDDEYCNNCQKEKMSNEHSMEHAMASAENALFGYTSNENAGDKRSYLVLNVSELARQMLNICLKEVNNDEGFSDDKKYSKAEYLSFMHRHGSNFISLQTNSMNKGVDEYEKDVKNYVTQHKPGATDEDVEAVLKEIKGESTEDTQNATSELTTESLIKYYVEIWQNISEKGWTNGGDDETITNAFKAGAYLLDDKTLANCKDMGLVALVDDKEAQEKADEEYDEATKAIKREEDRVDMEIQQVQTKITAIENIINSENAKINNDVKSFQYLNTNV
ncbi:hypothetical protein IJG72_02135 [bacterium]|nr:hypothetical protein [bacterium]